VDVDDYLLKLERNLMLGAGRWVAEFNESFRAFPVGEHTFDVYVRGGTRPRGFLLSRLFAYFSLPSYKVAFFAKHVPEEGLDLGELSRAVVGRASEHNVRWSWLVLIRSANFPAELVNRVDGFDKPKLGISLVNLAEEDVDTSSNVLGRKALSLVRIFK
jgi:hypothetical protein